MSVESITQSLSNLALSFGKMDVSKGGMVISFNQWILFHLAQFHLIYVEQIMSHRLIFKHGFEVIHVKGCHGNCHLDSLISSFMNRSYLMHASNSDLICV